MNFLIEEIPTQFFTAGVFHFRPLPSIASLAKYDAFSGILRKYFFTGHCFCQRNCSRLLYENFARSNFMRYHFCWECTILPKFLPAGQFHRFIGSRRELFCCITLQVSAWNGKFHLFWIHNKSTSFCVTASKKALSRWQAFCPGWNRINSIWLSTLDLSFYENPSLNWAENCFVSF